MSSRKTVRILVLILCMMFCAGSVGAEVVIEEDAVINRIDVKPEEMDTFSFADDAKLLEIWFPNIRDADAAVLIYDGEVWMIDCGDERAALRTAAMLRQLGIHKIDKLFISHPHHDHLNGLEITDDTAKIQEMLISFPEDSTEHMIRAMENCRLRGITVSHYKDGDTWFMGDGAVSLTFWQLDDPQLSMNDRSAICMLRYKGRSMLFTADLENRGQRAFLARMGEDAFRADIFKYPHHGKIGLVDEFFYAIGAQMAIVTNSRGTRDGTKYLMYKHIDHAFTNRQDYYVHLLTDGEHWVCENAPILPDTNQ